MGMGSGGTRGRRFRRSRLAALHVAVFVGFCVLGWWNFRGALSRPGYSLVPGVGSDGLFYISDIYTLNQ